jgi:uncharacterized membrane protein YphA (DoxX/SURF4 family)
MQVEAIARPARDRSQTIVATRTRAVRDRASAVPKNALASRVGLVRAAFGAIWAIDAWYKWQPAFQHQFAAQITRPAKTAPALLHSWYQFWTHLIVPHAAFFGLTTALAETALAAALLLGIARRPVYLLGALFALMIWAVPEGFGRFWTVGQTDLGTGIMYVFIFAALYVVDSAAGAGGWSVDRTIERLVPGWQRIAQP